MSLAARKRLGSSMSNKCKIIIMTDTRVGVPGGSERHLYNFLSNISEDLRAKVYQLNPNRNTFLKDGFSLSKNVELLSHPLQKLASLSSIFLFIKLLGDLVRYKPDVIISYHEKSDIINFLLKRMPFAKHKIITSKRDMGIKLEGRLGKIAKYITPRFDAVTSPSKMVTEHFIQNYSARPESSFIVHNGTDLNTFTVLSSSEKENRKRRLGIDPNRNTIISIGWLRKGKGHNYLIESLTSFDLDDEWQVVILGSGPEKDNLEQLASNLEVSHKVYLPGMQDNVSEWLSISDIAVSASLSEGLSNALIEACAACLPIVATNVGGNPEIVQDGLNGFLIESESSEEISKAIKRLLNDKSKMLSMAKESRLIAESKFSIPNMVSTLESLYLDMAKL